MIRVTICIHFALATSSALALDRGLPPEQIGPVTVTGPSSVLDNLTVSPSASHAGWTFQSTSTTAGDILGPQQPPGWFTHDGIRSVLVSKSDARAQTTSAFGFYVRNESPEAKTGATGVFGTTACVVDKSACWGLNPTVIDSARNGALTDGRGRKLIVMEGDISVTSPFTTVVGISLLGSSLAQPIAADGVVVSHLSAISPGSKTWTHAFVAGDGTSQVAYLTGAAAVGGRNVDGTPNFLNYFDGMGVAQAVRYRSAADGSLVLDGTVAPNGIKLAPASSGQFPRILSYGSDPNPGLVLQAQGAGQVVTESLLNATKGIYVNGGITEKSTSVPNSSSAPCAAGQHAWDANFEYRCVASNTWKRAALLTW